MRVGLLADSAGWIKTDPHDSWPADNEWHQDPDQYVKTMDVVLDIPGCVGFHLCGAYLRNLARNYGLRDNFEHADVDMLLEIFNKFEAEASRIIEMALVLPAYEYCLKCSHVFNMLDARGAISVTERTGYIVRIRNLARACAEAYLNQRKKMGYPLLKRNQSL